MKFTGMTVMRAARVLVAILGLAVFAMPLTASHAAFTSATAKQDNSYFEARVVQGPDRGARLAGILHLAFAGDGQLRGTLTVVPDQQRSLTTRPVVPVAGMLLAGQRSVVLSFDLGNGQQMRARIEPASTAAPGAVVSGVPSARWVGLGVGPRSGDTFSIFHIHIHIHIQGDGWSVDIDIDI